MSYTVGDPRLPKRFWDKVKIVDCKLRPDLGPCWQWTASVNSKWGYAQFLIGSKSDHSNTMARAHKLAYETLVGPVPSGKELDHLCRNRPCVNPKHMETVTHKINMQRGIAGILERERQKALTHCRNGHLYTPESTSFSGGWRRCLICRREAAKTRYHADLEASREYTREWRKKNAILNRK